jgi:hypothetical protein
MAKAALQTAAGALNGMTLGSGLAIGGLALGLGGWQLGSAIDKATDHSYRALLAAEHWGARLDKIDVKEWGRRADEAAQSWQGAGVELKRQSELWREATEKAAEASSHVRRLCGNQTSASGCPFLDDDAAVLARSSGEESTPARRRAGLASMACRSTRRFSTNAP